MKRKAWAASLALIVALPAGAEPSAGQDGVAWLQRIATAAREVNYQGTFVYQYGDHVETSRIIHLVNETGEHEKLEALDGPPREIIRSNDTVRCYLPADKTLKVDRRKARQAFPALLPEQISSLQQYYRIRMVGTERIAGHDTQVLALEPKDGMRYGYRLWAEAGSGLLLKRAMLDDSQRSVEQIAFTQVEIGKPIDPALLKPRFEARVAEWSRRESGETEAAGAKPSASGWKVGDQPPGFRKVLETRRQLAGKAHPVTHIMFSDGMAAVSVFIEPVGARHPPLQHLSNQGALNIYSREVDSHLVTVVGEAPAATVMKIANSVAREAR
ncbi:MAG TPA: MucB/RseB C-terminal domain-containing protein [Pelomicrobium sp.]|nr:MucB/RseB C-terminal domain-containing protein [Pelomicrobium sp.]